MLLTLPARFLSAKIVLGLGAALALSIAGNGWLFWKLAQAKPIAELKCVQGTLAATVDAEAAEDKRDATASTIARDTATQAEESATTAQVETDQAKTRIEYVYLKAPAPPAGSCTGEPPAGVREQLEALRDKANAAGH